MTMVFGSERTFALAPVSLQLETTSAFRLPEYAGALFRGGFGKFFRDLVCTTHKPVCAGCPEIDHCSYAQVFESPVDPSQFTVLRKYPNAPHPFVLTPPLHTKGLLPAGSIISLQLALIGPGIEYLPYFIHVFDAMGSRGSFGGRFRVSSVKSCLEPDILVYDGGIRRILRPPPQFELNGEMGSVRRLRLNFVTPLRMRVDGHYKASPSFIDITQALLRRIHLLSVIYGAANPDSAWMRPLLAAADNIRTVSSTFTPFRWSRMSGSQGRRIDMDGIAGALEAEGDLTTLASWFRVGAWLHVGSGTSLGMGRYQLLTGD